MRILLLIPNVQCLLIAPLSFSETFEGLGVGSRLAYLEFPTSSTDKENTKPSKFEKWVPIWCAIIFGLTTPLGKFSHEQCHLHVRSSIYLPYLAGIAIGLGFRRTYDPQSATASIVSGVLDAFSAGVLIYTGLVELLAHDFLFNPAVTAPPTLPTRAGEQSHAAKEMRMKDGELAYSIACVMLGCGGMAVLGRWA